MRFGSLILRVSCAAIAVAVAGSAASATEPAVNGWGVPLTDVTPDPSILYGTLPNGMKYAIMRNATPKGTAAVRLQFAFGSIAEAENERGLAHFIEHMAFNGSTHVAEGDMIKMLQRQGLAFGPDTNAFTGFDTTTYVLDLPKVDDEHLDTAFFLFREIGSEVKFDPASVNRERGVILSEERSRDNFKLHEQMDEMKFQVPLTPYPNRLPIGLDSVLKTASADTIRSLYHRYYRPEKATLIFVGDADPALIKAKIVKAFSDWQGVGPAGAPLPRGKVDLDRPAAFGTFVDPAAATSVDYAITRPWDDPADTLATRRRNVIRAIAEAAFNRRLQRIVSQPGSPVFVAGMGTSEQRDAARMSEIEAASKDGAWRDAVGLIEQELRRANEFGFTMTELRAVVGNMRGTFQTEASQQSTRSNSALAGLILTVVGRNRFLSTPVYAASEFDSIVKTLTPSEVNAAFRQMWSGSAPLIHLSTKDDVSSDQVAAAFTASKQVAVAALKDEAAATFAYDNVGTPGTIVEDKRIPDLGVRTIRFANNVRLNIKTTDFEADKVRFAVRLGNGVLDLPKDQPGLAPMMSLTSAMGGLPKHSLEQLKEIFVGKAISVGTAVQDDAFVASGSTSRRDLALQMKVSAAYLLHPGFRPEASERWVNALPIVEKQVDAQPEAVAGARVPILLASGDARFGMPPQAVLAKRTFDEARAAIAPVAASAPIEITIVGDVDEATAIAAVASSFGALPTRELSDPIPPDRLAVKFRSDRSPIELVHDGPADKAVIEAIWPTTDDSNFREAVGVDLLGDVLELMLTDSVREKLGDSYGVSVSSQMSNVFPGFGYLTSAAVVAPDKTDEVQKAIAEAAAELRAHPVSADILVRARNPELDKADRVQRDNAYWLGSLSQAQSHPDRLERIRKLKEVMQSVTPAELQKLARKYLRPDRVQTVRIVSRKAPQTASR